jgi:hypothetical protein
MWTRLKPDHDVIMTLSEVREKLPFKLISVYVRGHQDDKRDYDDLTRPEQLNVLADHRASTALQDLCVAGQPTRFYPLPACRGYLRDTSGDILNREQRTLRTEFPGCELRAYLQKRNNWTDQVYDSISWPVYRSATALLTDSVWTFVVKLSSSSLPVGVRER